MSETYVQLPPDGTGKKRRALLRTVEGEDVYEEIVVLINPSTGNMIDPRDILDREGRLLGIIYGDIGKLLQKPTTRDLLVQLRSAGSEIDPRNIRTLTATDIVTIQQAVRTSLKVQPEREDIISVGGVASPNNNGIVVVPATVGQKIKVYDAGFHGAVDGLHCFFFGTSSTLTTKRFCTLNTKGAVHKTFIQPRIGDTSDALYIYSSVAETNMPYDIGYIKE